jgi:hypothetical protein
MRVLNVHQRWLPGPPEPVGALIEDLLDRAELEVTGTVASPARWSPWVSLLRGAEATQVPARG